MLLGHKAKCCRSTLNQVMKRPVTCVVPKLAYLLLFAHFRQPPVLDASKSKVDGLAFLGLSLSRFSDEGHSDSITNQTAFDLNDVIDREVRLPSV